MYSLPNTNNILSRNKQTNKAMIKFKGNKRTLPPVAILNKTKPGRITLSDVKMHHTVLEVQPNVVLTFTDRLKELSIANRNQSIH